MIGSLRNSIATAVAAFLGAVPLVQLNADPRLLPGAAVVVVVLAGLGWLARRLSRLTWPGTVAQLLAGFIMVWIGSASASGAAGQTRPWQVFALTWNQAGAHIYGQSVPMAADDATLVLLLTGVGVLTIAIDLAFIAVRSVLLAALPLLGGYLTSMIVLDEAVSALDVRVRAQVLEGVTLAQGGPQLGFELLQVGAQPGGVHYPSRRCSRSGAPLSSGVLPGRRSRRRAWWR